MMRKTKLQRVACSLLALLLLLGGATVGVGAQELETTILNPSVTTKTIADYREELESVTYDEYSQDFHAYDKATDTVVIDALADLDETQTTLKWLTEEEWTRLSADPSLASTLVGIYAAEYDGVKALYTPGDGTVTFTTNAIPKEGRYSIRITYWPVIGKAASIERELYIDGKATFKEARSLSMPKVWSNDYRAYSYPVAKGDDVNALLSRAEAMGLEAKTEEREGATYLILTIPETWTQENSSFLLDELNARFFTTDLENNELRPTAVQTPCWSVYEVKDNQGYYTDSFEFVLIPDENGEVSISLKGMNEPMAVSKIELLPHETTLTYEEYIAQYADAPKGTSTVKLEAEMPSSISTNTVYPAEDRASAATSPADTSRTLLNVIGGEKWQTAGQSVSYQFSVDKTGLYTIDMRYKQDVLDGLFVSRSLSLYSDGLQKNEPGYYDGYPFAEAAQLRFNYSSYWQSTSMTDGSHDEQGNERVFEFYLVEGVTYTMTLEVTLGTMSETIRSIEGSMNSINNDYLNILRLTGSSPDEYRDYHFTRIMPQTLADLVKQSFRLEETAENLASIAGTASSTTATLKKVSDLLYRMHDEDEIAKRLNTLKTYIGSIGTFLSDAKKQPLQLDYIVIQSPDAELPVAEPGFFAKMRHEISSFIQSFFRDYNAMGAMEEIEGDALEVWVAYGRDQSQVIRNLVTNDFTYNTGIPVDLKLVSGGTLLPSILAGMGPDVYLGMGHGEVINYAIRGALATLDVDSQGNVREDFDEVANSFTESAMLVLGIENAEGEMHYYGLPETQSFPMLFVRIDILSNLNIEIPKTWNDIYQAQTVLEGNNMEIGLTQDYTMFLYQAGGELFADNGMRINLDSKEGLLAFETMCNLFTMHSFPYQYDAANRFRTGEMPILIADYTGMYNQLKVFATEIEGLWKFVPLPGIESEDGRINNAGISGVSADILINGSDHEQEAWEYLKWYTGASCQTAYANDMMAIIGDSAKHPTANKEALASMPWTTEEYTEVARQFQNLASVPNYPGSYYIGRYTGFAFLDAYNNDADPTTELLSYINTINKEITRKRSEFGLETLEVGQTKAEKRFAQARVAMELLSEKSSSYEEILTAANIAMLDEDIVILEECASLLMARLASLDPAAYTVKVFKQDQLEKNGGYKIDSLSEQQLIYFTAQCFTEAAAALRTY